MSSMEAGTHGFSSGMAQKPCSSCPGGGTTGDFCGAAEGWKKKNVRLPVASLRRTEGRRSPLRAKRGPPMPQAGRPGGKRPRVRKQTSNTRPSHHPSERGGTRGAGRILRHPQVQAIRWNCFLRGPPRPDGRTSCPWRHRASALRLRE